MQGSKIRLSAAEAELFGNAEIILTKNSILQKTVALLAHIQEELATNASKQNLASTPKISKGENYLGLPYVILDYPRIAAEKDLFFIRSMFWWGHFFSSTLHIAGHYKEANLSTIVAAYEALLSKNFYVSINSDPWQHHFEPSNYTAIASLSKEEFIRVLLHQTHIKIATQWPLSDWNLAPEKLVESWKLLEAMIKTE